MKKILVTGAKGFLASRFIAYYKDTFDITAVGRDTFDLTDESAVMAHFSGRSYDYVFHFAALSDTGYCEKHPEETYRVNTLATTYIAKACALHNATLIFASSDQVYNGNLEAGPYTEAIRPCPNTVYARAKLAAEESIQVHLTNYYILRLPWLFGLPERFKKTNTNILTNIQKALITHTPLTLPTQDYRSLTYVYDIIENLIKLLDLPFGVYNYGSENNEEPTYAIGKFVVEALCGDVHCLLPNHTFTRDLRIANTKLQHYGIHFPTTKESILKCLSEYGLAN